MIQNNIKQFSLGGIFAMVTSICVAFALTPHLPFFGIGIALSVSSFWLGIGMFVVSDNFDTRPIDQRTFPSWFFNVAGLWIVIFSVIGFGFCLYFNAAILFHFFFPSR